MDQRGIVGAPDGCRQPRRGVSINRGRATRANVMRRQTGLECARPGRPRERSKAAFGVCSLVGAWVFAGCADSGAPGAGAVGGAAGSTSAPCETPACSAPPESPPALPPGAPDVPVTVPSGGEEQPPAIGGIAQATDGGLSAVPALDAGAPVLDRCDVGVLDPARPPRALELRGNLGAHDPVIIAADGAFRYFSTGDGISVKTSPDLLQWTQQPEVFPVTPAWFSERVPAYAPRNIWAPDISFFGGQYHLYYSVSSFGSNRSCIGHATRASLATGQWLDREAVFCSNPPGRWR